MSTAQTQTSRGQRMRCKQTKPQLKKKTSKLKIKFQFLAFSPKRPKIKAKVKLLCPLLNK